MNPRTKRKVIQSVGFFLAFSFATLLVYCIVSAVILDDEDEMSLSQYGQMVDLDEYDMDDPTEEEVRIYEEKPISGGEEI